MTTERTFAIVISTSRRPAQGVRTFCKELAWALPQTTLMPRGSSSFRELAHKAFSIGASRLIIVDSRENKPDKIKIYRLETGCLEEIIKIRIIEAQLKRERKSASRVKESSLIAFEFQNVMDWLQKKMLDSFSPILASSKTNSKRIHTFIIGNDSAPAPEAYTGVVIDPKSNTIVSPSFKFTVAQGDNE